MKLKATFETVELAEFAIRKLKESGLNVISAKTSPAQHMEYREIGPILPVFPFGFAENNIVLNGNSSYSAGPVPDAYFYMGLIPPLGANAGEAVVTVEVDVNSASSAYSVLFNMHGYNIIRF